MSILIPNGSSLTTPQDIAEYTAGTKTGSKHYAIVICDSAGNPVGSAPGAAQTNSVLPVGGSDGTNTQRAAINAKGAQGALGLAVQNLKDAGRQSVTLFWDRMAGVTGADSALQNWTTGQRGGALITQATVYTVSAGKTLRIQQVNISIRNVTTATLTGSSRVRIRQATTVANTSAIIWEGEVSWEPPGATATLEAAGQECFPIPDGLEVAAGQQITVTHLDTTPNCTVSATILGYEY